ncbi:MAG TPA: hypothetical protein VG055_12710 [Planctomycetaceae bacterium]|jgi:hypothetical protein|nr:hypothetical protein [Planctomycetaceae bacterium]
MKWVRRAWQEIGDDLADLSAVDLSQKPTGLSSLWIPVVAILVGVIGLVAAVIGFIAVL